MIKFSTDGRVFVSDALRDIANLAAAGMLFGQFVADRPFSPWIGLGGVALWFGCMGYAVALRRRKD